MASLLTGTKAGKSFKLILKFFLYSEAFLNEFNQVFEFKFRPYSILVLL